MEKTIRQRIDAMHQADRLYHKLDYEYPIDDATEEETTALVAATQAADQLDASIIADWNAALAAMKDSITYDIEDHEDGRWYCHFCSGNYTVGHTDDCRVLPLQATLAQMEGHSHSRDEAMVEDAHTEHEVSDEYHKRVVGNERVVGGDHHRSMGEDKRYERDDIYKK